MIVIALAGRAQHGKTSLITKLQDHLARKHSIQCERLAFADTVKLMLTLLGLNEWQLYGLGKSVPIPEFGDKTPRFMMQSLATGWGRKKIDDDIWVNIVDKRLALAAKGGYAKVVLIDDVRHVPEIEMLRRHGAYIFEVYRPAIMPQTFFGKLKHWFKSLRAHSSERLNFQKHGLKRIIAEEGDTAKTLQKLLAEIPELR